MSDDLFNTPTEEINRLVAELRETKESVRELSSKLARIETRLRRAFPASFPKKTPKTTKGPSAEQPPTMTTEQAMSLYGELVGLARNGNFDEVRRKLSLLELGNLSLLRRELGASLGKKKPSAKTLTEAIVGRVKESVMLSKHTNRQELLDQEKALGREEG